MDIYKAMSIAEKVANEYLETGQSPNELINKYASELNLNDNWKQRIVEITNIRIFEKLAERMGTSMVKYEVAEPYVKVDEPDYRAEKTASIEKTASEAVRDDKDWEIAGNYMEYIEKKKRRERIFAVSIEKTASEKKISDKQKVSAVQFQKELLKNIDAAIYAIESEIRDNLDKIAAEIQKVPKNYRGYAIGRLAGGLEKTAGDKHNTEVIAKYLADKFKVKYNVDPGAPEIDRNHVVFKSYENIVNLSKVASELTKFKDKVKNASIEDMVKLSGIFSKAVKFLGKAVATGFKKNPKGMAMLGLGAALGAGALGPGPALVAQFAPATWEGAAVGSGLAHWFKGPGLGRVSQRIGGMV